MRTARVLVALSFVLLVMATPHEPRAQGGHGPGLGLGSSEEVRFPAGQDSVAIRFENWGEHIVIPVSVNGRPPLHMVFDTGMPIPGVLLYEDARVDSMGLAFGPMRVRVGGAGGTGAAAEARLATGVTLRTGTLEVAGSIAIVMPPTPQMSGLHDGIIGASLFQGLVVSIDHDRGVMTLTRREAFTPPAGATEVPLEVVGRHAYVQAGLVDAAGAVTPVKLIVDLGATHSVSLNRTTHAAIRAPERALDSRIGRGMSGAVTGKVGRLPAFELGGHRLSRVVATFPDSAFEHPRGLDSRNGNLGGGILGRFNVAMDVAGSRMFLTPNRRFADPFDWDMTGIQYDMKVAGRIEVAEVMPGSPAAGAGIVPGDQLVAVDGVAAEPRALLRTRARFREEGRVLALTLRRDGRERVVKLKLRRLV